MGVDKTICISLKQIEPNIRRSALNKLNPDFSTDYRMIYHYQVNYVYEGKGIIEIEDVRYQAKKGDLFYWGPGQKHRITSSLKEPLVLLGVQFDLTSNHKHRKYTLDVTTLENFSFESVTEQVIFSDFDGFNHYTAVRRLSRAEELLMEIANEYKMQKILCEETMSGLFKSFLILIARQTLSERRVSDEKTEDLIDNVIKYVHEHYWEEITCKEIASIFNFHPNYISRLMVISTGVSLYKYVINLRINKAVELINETNKTLSEIALEIGFKNIHYFSRLFKKKTGVCPSSLRN